MHPRALSSEAPLVTIVMANHNGSRYVEAALRSVLSQTLRELEVLVVDDASTDDSVTRVAALAAEDPRVGLIPLPRNGGPAAARNAALDQARGRWIAIVDSDDLLHPERLERLVAAAEQTGAGIVADDMLVFDDAATDAAAAGTAPPPRALLGLDAARDVGLAEYVRSNVLYGSAPGLGYLKPVIRADLLDGMRYDPSLRIAEDYDLVARLLTHDGGSARLHILPELTYFYRKHGRSISHRLNRASLEAMLAADDRFRAGLAGSAAANSPDTGAALDARRASIGQALAFEDILAALKRRDLGGALRRAAASPRAALLLRLPLLARVQRVVVPHRRIGRRATAAASAAPRPRNLCVLSRQRLVGNTNGSSAYLLSLCGELRRHGFRLHLVCPSPATFGRWPAIPLRPEMAIFDSVRMRGAWRIGRFLVARDPRNLWSAAMTVADRGLGRLGLGGGRVKPAPYAMAVPWTRQDSLFVARHAPARADAILADYAFLSAAIPYALRPDAPSAIVMHDLFSSRPAQFARAGAADSVAVLEAAEESRLLSGAGAVIAIQAAEAETVRRMLPRSGGNGGIGGPTVITAPMAVDPVASPQPGGAGKAAASVLFVGSRAAPNVDGLRWFLDEAWPAVRAAVPDALLTVAGTVGGAIGAAVPPGVSLLGLVPDLLPLYRDAAVVVSPLRVGSGLKIKLIEALGQGKAVVATPATVQGVEDLARSAVLVEAEADGFAQAVVSLLREPARRTALADAALAAARARFSATACYREAVAFLQDGRTASSVPASAAPR